MVILVVAESVVDAVAVAVAVIRSCRVGYSDAGRIRGLAVTATVTAAMAAVVTMVVAMAVTVVLWCCGGGDGIGGDGGRDGIGDSRSRSGGRGPDGGRAMAGCGGGRDKTWQ